MREIANDVDHMLRILRCQLEWSNDRGPIITGVTSRLFEKYMLDEFGLEFISGKSVVHMATHIKTGVSSMRVRDEKKYLVFLLKYS